MLLKTWSEAGLVRKAIQNESCTDFLTWACGLSCGLAYGIFLQRFAAIFTKMISINFLLLFSSTYEGQHFCLFRLLHGYT